MSSGNTDTKYYWDLTPHIFRYNHKATPKKLVNGVHTVNECEWFSIFSLRVG